jgi:hypothetical protein
MTTHIDYHRDIAGLASEAGPRSPSEDRRAVTCANLDSPLHVGFVEGINDAQRDLAVV